MPVHTGKDTKGCFAQWGGSGKKYYYACGNASARSVAKVKADKQGVAIKANESVENKMKIRKVVANFTGLVRNDSMEERDYLVAPMIMIVEGVLEGSEGPLLYTAKELGKFPAAWNQKPVILYHPARNEITACTPEIITNRKMGVIMNATFEDGKLKAEAWLELDRIKKVDGEEEQIMNAIKNQEMVELSTGLFADFEKVEGEFNGKDYIGILHNYLPDHLALLPGLKGASSIEDGAGFLRLNEKKMVVVNTANMSDKTRAFLIDPGNDERIKLCFNRMIENEMSHSLVWSLLSSVLKVRNEDIWIEEVFDDFVIYELDGQLYKQNYASPDGEVTLIGETEEVVKVTEYRTKENDNVIGNRKENTMKEKIVNELISNVTTKWEEDDKELLMGMEESTLAKIAMPMVKNDDDNKDDDDKDDDDNKDDDKVKNAQPKSVEEYINDAPDEMRDVLRNGLASHNADKAKLITLIVANEKNIFTKEQLEKKDLDELKALAVLATNSVGKKPDTPNYDGQREVPDITINQEEEEPLKQPTLNYEKKAS